MAFTRGISDCFRAALLLALLAACTRLEDALPGPANEEEAVHVPISLAVAPVEDGMPGTKVDYEPEAPGYDASAAIKTITVLQFEKDAEGDGYTRVGNQVCYAWPLVAGESVSLVASSRENIIFVIANATAPGIGTLRLADHISLGDFLAKQNGNQLSALGSLDGTGIWYTPDGGSNRYLRMSSAVKVDHVESGTTLGSVGSPIYLKRNCAKVVINVTNTSSAPDKINIEAVQLRDINRQYHYVTNIPAGLPVAFLDSYSPGASSRFDNGEQAFPAATAQTYTYYIPANLRGTITNVSQADKNSHALQGATRFCIYATYGSSKSITYTYYLGANLKDDFNLEPNKKYVYNIDLNGKGNPATDSRIGDLSELTFNVDANCYMLKPPSRAGVSTTFSIPVRRAAVFWNQAGTNMGVYSAADRAASELLESSEWEAFLIWNEVKDKDGNPVAASELLTGSHDDGNGTFVVAGRGFNPQNGSANPFIKIKVSAGMRGNAVVAIRKTSSPTVGDILWSWHLWVTDYDPYVEMTPVAGTYIYAVPNGEIHRYADGAGKTIWTSGEYANGFIMDRNLGATMSNPPEYNPRPAVGFYYQKGRKDPFPYPKAVSALGADMTGEPPDGGNGPKYNVRYSIHHPQTFLGNHSHWTGYETESPVLGSSATAWIDPKIASHAETTDNCEAGKSIYDPCPYGWQVPADNTVWSDFSTANKLKVVAQSIGAYYYPNLLDTEGRIFYPVTGIYYYGYNVGNLSGVGLTSFICSARSGFQIYANVGGYPYGHYGSAIPVRCIRHAYNRPY